MSTIVIVQHFFFNPSNGLGTTRQNGQLIKNGKFGGQENMKGKEKHRTFFHFLFPVKQKGSKARFSHKDMEGNSDNGNAGKWIRIGCFRAS